jgi:hypothetical protein
VSIKSFSATTGGRLVLVAILAVVGLAIAGAAVHAAAGSQSSGKSGSSSSAAWYQNGYRFAEAVAGDGGYGHNLAGPQFCEAASAVVAPFNGGKAFPAQDGTDVPGNFPPGSTGSPAASTWLQGCASGWNAASGWDR